MSEFGTPQGSDVSPRDYVQSLERGLAVIRAFSAERRSMTLAEVASAAGISRPSARRFLITLQALGYVNDDGRAYRLLPKVLDLGEAYLASFSLTDIVEPHLDDLNRHFGAVCSVGILDGDSVVYIARSQARRIMATSVRVGSRVDPAATSVGRVLLAALSPADLREFLSHHTFRKYTEKTISSEPQLGKELAKVREQGFAIADQEIDLGMRTLGVPVRDASGHTVAAINVAVNYMQVSIDELRQTYLPRMQETARAIEEELATYGPAVVLA